MERQEEEVFKVNINVAEKNEQVTLYFDKAVSWIAIDPVQAIKLAEQMKVAAISILRSEPKPLSTKPT